MTQVLCMLGGAVHVGALLGVGFSPELYQRASWRLQSRRKLADLAQSGTYGIWRCELPAINCSSLIEASSCSSLPGCLSVAHVQGKAGEERWLFPLQWALFSILEEDEMHISEWKFSSGHYPQWPSDGENWDEVREPLSEKLTELNEGVFSTGGVIYDAPASQSPV